MSAAEQIVPESAPLGRALDLTGQRFGMLVALVRVVDEGKAARWLLECDCGRLALRHASQLIHGKKEGQEACCSVCLRELFAGFRIDRKNKRQYILRKAYDATGSLYGADYDDQFVANCLAEADMVPDEPLQEQRFESDDTRGQPGHGIHLYPISCHTGWLCWQCGKPFTSGFGCVACVEPICETCVDLHIATRSEFSMTLHSIAIDFGVTQERIRQAQDKALRKLRHPSRSKLLRPYVEPDFLEVRAPHDLPDVRIGSHCGSPLSRTAGGMIYCSRCGATDKVPTDTDYRKASATLFKYRKSYWEDRAAALVALYRAETGTD